MPKGNGKKKTEGNGPAVLLLIICCTLLGYMLGSADVIRFPESAGTGSFFVDYLLQLMLMFLSFFLQLIIHEGGHLAAGLLTGYRFSSFRIGSLMLLKTSKGYSFKKYSLAGTGGQCLLIPPEKRTDGTYPYKLYHLGGVLLNLTTAVLFFVIFLFQPGKNAFSNFTLYLSAFGLLTALMNGIPMRVNGIATDGYNVLHIGKEPFALDAMWLQLIINAEQTEGRRLKDMPEEWFLIPENANKHNEIISTIAVFSENRAMDALDFKKAKKIIAMLEESSKYSVIGLYKNLLLLDKVTIDLIENGANTDISSFDSRQNKAFRKAMSGHPSVIRTEYAVRLLKDRDPEKAKKSRELLNKVAKSFPLQSDIEAEQEIIRYLDFCSADE